MVGRRQHAKAAWLWRQRQPIIGSIAEVVRARLADFNAGIHQRFAGDIEQARTEHEEIVAAYQLWRERTETRWLAIQETLEAEAPDLSEVEWPEPKPGDEDPDPLFDSRRDYVQQIDTYKAFQGKPTVRKPRSG